MEGIDADLQESSRALISKSEQIVKHRKLQRNIALAIDRISLCLPMLEKYAKLQEQMESKRWRILPTKDCFNLVEACTIVSEFGRF